MWRKRIESLRQEHLTQQTLVTETSALLAANQAELAAMKEAQVLVQQTATLAQETAHRRIAQLVTECLRAVFDDPYEFRIEFDRKRGRTEARCLVVRGDCEIDPLEAAGGGVVDVIAFALRLIALTLKRPERRRLLILDEPFKFVSEEYRERIRDLLLTLSEDLGIQMVIVTHIRELEIGHVIRL